MLRKFITFLLIILGSLIMDAFFMFIFLNATQVTCLLQPNEAYTCQMRTLLFGKIPTFGKMVEEVVDIKVESDSCSDGCAYRAEFVTRQGDQVPLNDVYTDHGPVQDQVNALRPLLKSGQPTIAYTADPPWWIAFLMGGLTLMTLLLSPLVFLRGR